MYTYTVYLINSTNREHAKAHALWPLLRCVAVVLRCGECVGGCDVWLCKRVRVVLCICCGLGVYVCVSAHVYDCANVDVIANVKACSQVYVYVHMKIYVYMWYVYGYVFVHVHVDSAVDVSFFVDVHVCVHVNAST